MTATDRAAARAWLASTGAAAEGDPVARLSRIARAFGAFPYENLTKILRRAEGGDDRDRGPATILADHGRWGAGGTCFSLTAFLAAVLAEAGFGIDYRLADRSYLEASHSALEVAAAGRRWLVDPGYLLDRPIPLDEDRPIEVRLPAEVLRLEPDPTTGAWSLWTVAGTHRKFRYSLRPERTGEADFRDRWADSLEWPMMDSLVLSRTTATGRHYLRDVHYHYVGADLRRQGRIDPLEGDVLREAFGIDPELFQLARYALGKTP